MGPSIDEKWTYISMLDRLTNGDITKLDEVCRRNWIEALNFMSYWHVRDIYYEAMNKLEAQKHK